MNKQQMEAVWNGPLQSALKKARFTKTIEFEQELRVYRKELVSSYTKRGFYANKKQASDDLDSKLRAELYLEFPRPWAEGIIWEFGFVREVV